MTLNLNSMVIYILQYSLGFFIVNNFAGEIVSRFINNVTNVRVVGYKTARIFHIIIVCLCHMFSKCSNALANI